MALELRPYQFALIARLRELLHAGKRRVVAYLPTGAGKTEVAIEITHRHLGKGGRVMFVVHLLELIEQTSRRFQSAGIDHGVVQAQHWKTDADKPVQVCSIQTLNRRIFLPDSTLIIVDECHRSTSGSYLKLIRRNNALPVIGLTATPFTRGMAEHDQAIGGPLWEDMAVVTTIRELVDQGYLVDCDVYAPSTPDLQGVTITAGDYNERQLAGRLNKATLIGDIVFHWERHANGWPSVCFAVDIAHSKHIVQRFREHGIAGEHIDCYTAPEERTAILSRLRSGHTKVVSNCAVLAEGFDLPDLRCMILARPTRSLTRYLQMIGRALRPAPGKTKALVLDHSGSVQRLGFPTDDLPLLLDDGARKATGPHQCRPRLPQPCPNCAYVKPVGIHTCPACGFAPERSDLVEVLPGDLTLLRRSQGQADKQSMYSQLLAIARQRGYHHGWVAHRYHTYFGVWPNGLERVEAEPTSEVRRWVTSQDIRYAKTRKRIEHDRASA